MATIRQAQKPPANLKNMEPISSPALSPKQVPPISAAINESNLSSTATGPIPAVLGTVYDSIKQWVRPGNAPQYRIFPLPLKANSQVGSIVNSIIESQPTVPVTPTSDLSWKGNWLPFQTYNIYDIVQFNISTYMALNTSTGVEPDNHPISWVLLSKNLNFRGEYTSPPETFVQSATGGVGGGGSGTGSTCTTTFSSNNQAHSTILVYLNAGISFSSSPSGDPSLLLTISDTQNNVYTLIGFESLGWGATKWSTTAIYMAVNVKAGPNVITTSSSASPGSPSNAGVALAVGALEYTGQAAISPEIFFTSFASAGATSAPLLLTNTSPNQIALLMAISRSSDPAGFVQRDTYFDEKVLSTVGSTTYTLPLTGTDGVAFGFVLSANSTLYEPYDVVQYQGSTYVCVITTVTAPSHTNSNWYLLSQGTGSINSLGGNYTALLEDYGKLITNTSSSSYTLKLPNPPPLSEWWIAVQNSGSGSIVVNPNGLNLDSSGSNLTLNTNQGILIFTDGINYFTERGFGTGTVTSVALSLPGIFTVSGSPVTSAGTLTAILATETANTVFAGPSSGAAAIPTFRALTANDLMGLVPVVVAKSSLLAQSASITATTIYAVPSTGAGLYRINWRAAITVAASGSSSLGGTNGFQTKYTDKNDSVVKTSNPTMATISAGNTTATTISGDVYANCEASTNLQYLFDYSSTGITGMVYDLDVFVEFVGTTQLSSDNFTRADANPLSGNWTGLGLVNFQIVGNVAEQSGNSVPIAGEINTAVSWPNDGYSEITVGTLSNASTFIGPSYRMNTGGNGYGVLFASGTGTAFLQSYTAGSGSTISSATLTIVSGDIIRLMVQGTTLTVTQNGVIVLTGTSSAYASGSAGVIGFNIANALNTGTITSWAGGQVG